MSNVTLEANPSEKFQDPDFTLTGEDRALVPFSHLDTLWINTGTLCNITCRNCYIESSPKNDRLVYITAAEASSFLAEAQNLGTREIGFTGGEPFLNPDFPDMLTESLKSGFSVLVLTNAMLPMQRPQIKKHLLELNKSYRNQLTIRVSLDHYAQERHEEERGQRTWDVALAGLDWLSENNFRLTIGGRTCWGETEDVARQGYAGLIADHRWPINADDVSQLVLFPEMGSEPRNVPEITTACWDILKTDPGAMMCATSRMIVKRKGAKSPTVLPCTLLPYDERFDMGATLQASQSANGGMFKDGAVKLCHSNCATFCVLGGGSCG